MSKKKISVFIIVLGVVLLILGVVLMFLNKEETPEEPKEPVIEEVYLESLNPNDDLVQSLYNRTKGYWAGDLYEENYYYYKEDKLLVSSFEMNHLFNLVFERIYKKGDLSSDLTVKEDVVKTEFNEIFGTYVAYSRLDLFTNGCYHVLFSNESNEYKYFMTNGCVDAASVISEVTAAHRYNTKIVIEESVLVSDGNNYYYDVDFLNKSSSTIIDVNDSNIQKYNYTFMYDKDLDKYYFYSVEKVK